MNYKVAQKKFTKAWEREETPQMVEFLNIDSGTKCMVKLEMNLTRL